MMMQLAARIPRMGPLLGVLREDRQVTHSITQAPPVSRTHRASNGLAA
jgi:hypothetical protein